MVRPFQIRTSKPRRHARFHTRRRAVAVIGTLAALGASGATWLANSSNASAPNAAPARTASPFVAPALHDTAYTIPPGAVFVAPQRSGGAHTAARASGSSSAPYSSVAQAVQHSNSGSTIVVRGGTYRETLGTITKRVTIQPYPHETVWFNGAAVLGNMARAGNGWVRTGWNPHICRTCYAHGALDPHYPYAGLPDQVFFDGRPQIQVGSLRQLGPGRFFVDARAGRLYVGSNPNGHHVEATMFEKAVQFGGRSAGSVVRGIGFAHYAAHYNMDVPTMVIVNTPNVTLDRDVFALSAGRGVSVFRSGAVVTHNIFAYNGINAFHANTADGLDFEHNLVVGSNYEHWSIQPTSSASVAGAKITSTNNGVIRGNLFFANAANGIWLDVSSSHFSVTNNNVVGSAGMGIAVELSAYVVVAGNVSSGNARIGLKISGANNVSAWNNTLANNGWAQIGVYEDPRSNPHRTYGVTWNTANVSVVNNVLIGRTGATKSVLDSFDGNHPARTTTARMVTTDDRNVWGRPVPASPRYMAAWQNSGHKAVYTTLSAIQRGTGRERHSISADKDSLASMFVNAGAGDYRLTRRNAAMTSGMAIPGSIASAMGVKPGVAPHLGALSVPAL